MHEWVQVYLEVDPLWMLILEFPYTNFMKKKKSTYYTHYRKFVCNSFTVITLEYNISNLWIYPQRPVHLLTSVSVLYRTFTKPVPTFKKALNTSITSGLSDKEWEYMIKTSLSLVSLKSFLFVHIHFMSKTGDLLCFYY